MDFLCSYLDPYPCSLQAVNNKGFSSTEASIFFNFQLKSSQCVCQYQVSPQESEVLSIIRYRGTCPAISEVPLYLIIDRTSDSCGFAKEINISLANFQ